eukprot:TRINITY_DN1210_c0_g1_i2.p1 TRINITY_DN1210_c0_g1~~TRINITY_DN1210_c0_g1_i2.p1  ORF type:complete len:317 (-),score=96.63 TRINITY_DN1210_c0_g1_i2:23-973(-)
MAGWREHGSKPGSGGVASSSITNADRRERLRQLALETIDLAKDPYFMKNHLGSYECKLCLTLHNNEGSYLAHTQGRRHQMNLARRAARDMRETSAPQPLPGSVPNKIKPRKTIKIGRPGYKVVKERDPDTNQLSLQFSIEYPEIEDSVKPRYRFMSSFEQRIEPQDKNYQYLLFAAEPYETIAFKIPNKDIEKNVGPQVPGESKFWTKWDEDTKTFSLQLHFKPQKKPGGQPSNATQQSSRPTTTTTTGGGSSSQQGSRYDPMMPKGSGSGGGSGSGSGGGSGGGGGAAAASGGGGGGTTVTQQDTLTGLDTSLFR